MPSRYPLPPASPPLLHHHTSSPLLPPLAATTAVLSLLLLLLLAFLYRKLSHKRTAPTPFSDLRRFPFSLLRRSTSSFSPSHRLGQGGFGSVYRAALPSGESVAVKLMDPTGPLQGEREFHNELSLASLLGSSPSPFVVSILGYSSSSDKRKVLVYELMDNGSLQDTLLDRNNPELLRWERRFKVVLDVARAVHFLHTLRVVHGDVKPSNVLLDSQFNAKLGDFGLARVFEEGEPVLVQISGGDEEEEEEEEVEKDNGSIVETESCSYATNGDGASPETPALALGLSVSLSDQLSVEGGNNINSKKKGDSGRDWWWKQEGSTDRRSESGRVKDYVMEWIGSEIKKERPKSNQWAGGSTAATTTTTTSTTADAACSAGLKKKKRLDWWNSLDREDRFWKKDKGRRKPREWWREEFCEELTRKNKRKKKKRKGAGDLWWQRDDDFSPERERKKRKSRTSLGSIDWWLDGLSGEIRSGRRNSQDWASGGDVPKSGGISSTPSMRGTVCYIAPEYGGGGLLSEKCDVYSFGVLMLVAISGRRPLQVTASPISEFERANLISWARQLAYNGKLLDLVDPLIESLDREQALLCITIALLCLQRSPSKRPDMKEVVEMLCGETELPHLPFEFSPSPPSNLPFKSRKKPR